MGEQFYYQFYSLASSPPLRPRKVTNSRQPRPNSKQPNLRSKPLKKVAEEDGDLAIGIFSEKGRKLPLLQSAQEAYAAKSAVAKKSVTPNMTMSLRKDVSRPLIGTAKSLRFLAVSLIPSRNAPLQPLRNVPSPWRINAPRFQSHFAERNGTRLAS